MTPAIFGMSGARLTDDERDFFRDSVPAGYILFGRNCIDRDQLRALTAELRALHGRDDLFICIDQEGGRVARMKPPEWTRFPSGEIFDRLYQVAPASAMQAARLNAQALGLELAEVGITVDCHPPLDIRWPGGHDVIGDRALGAEPMQVAALGRAILQGLGEAGVAGCIKHMPGHGRSNTDTHKSMPMIEASAEELEIDMQPFRALNHAPIGMTGHLLFTAWDRENAATLSPTIIADQIRGHIGFDGLLLTDDIDMQALSGTIPERSARAIAAGCDLVLNCWAKMDDMIGIANAVPEAGGKTLERLNASLEGTGTRQDGSDQPDSAELLATRDALLAAAGVSG